MKRICRISGEPFEVTEEDLSFYNRISPTIAGKTYTIPPPTLAPSARRQRHMTFRNERTLYRRKCAKTGKAIVSIYAPEAPFPVFEPQSWFADDWDATAYGRDFDFSRPFFDQFAELSRAVPRPALLQRLGNENSPYTNLVSGNHNCHYIFAASDNQDCFYSTYIQRCRDVADSFFIFDSELCYECIDCYNGYNLRHCQECNNCSDSEHLIGCIGCRDCFGCISLISKQYCLFNQQLSKSAYFEAVTERRARPDAARIISAQLQQLRAIAPRKYYSGIDNDGCTGDHLAHCKNSLQCYDCTTLEDCKNCTWLHRSRDCYDCYAWGLPGELGLENHLVGNTFYRVIFSEDCSDNVSYLSYCQACYISCSHLFGCIGLRRKQHCILNKQYSPEAYEQLLPKVIEHLIGTGEWGEFFPSSLSPFGYNETLAQEYFPLSQQEVAARGWRWRTEELPGIYGADTTSLAELNRPLAEIDDSICSKVFACVDTGKHFRFTKQELALYRKLNVSLPPRCFDARYLRRFALRNPRMLHHRECIRCAAALLSPFPPNAPEPIHCERCFLDVMS